MEIVLNNRSEIIEKESVSVRELLQIKNFTFKMLVIRVNGNLIKKDQYDTAIIKSGDIVNVIHLISGG